jgi:tetratricopeptide (TPR) repeat protein
MNALRSRFVVAVSAVLSAASVFLSTADSPMLKIGGKESSDVYLQSLDVSVEVTGNIASTRYTMVFKNKTGRILEGELTFPLPDGRSVTYYALDIAGKMRDAVPVEKEKATRVFEEIEQRRVDPGLLERVEGNNFRTRIYPIWANGTRTISIGYEEELTLENGLLRYRLPMAYPDPIQKFTVKATVWRNSLKPIVADSTFELRFDKTGENYVASFARENYRPARSLNFALPAPADIPQVLMQPAQGSHYFFASVAPKTEIRKKQWDNELAIIWDVSLSGSQRDLKREIAALDIIFAEKKNAVVHLYFLSNTLNRIVNKNTANGEYNVSDGKWDELKKVLENAVFDGGTDFSKIYLSALAGNEILFFSDGLSTLGDADFIKNTPDNLKRPIHCVVSSAKADYSAMRLIAGKTKGKFMNLNAMSAKELKTELLNETLQFLGTEHGKSIREVYPSIATPVHNNFSMAGISDTNKAELTLLFGFGNKIEKRIKVTLDAKKADTLVKAHRLWAQKKIAELDLTYEKNRAELTELGQQFCVVTRNTSLIVLETIEDYIRYNITPPVELREEFYRKQKTWSTRWNTSEQDILTAAKAAAILMKIWRDTGSAPKMPKYPTPDSEGGGYYGAKYVEPAASVPRITTKSVRMSSINDAPVSSQSDALVSSQTKDAALSQSNKQTSPQTKEPALSQNNKQTPSQSNEPAVAKNTPAANTASSSPKQTQPKKGDAKNASSKSMAFESAEIMGYLDNPTPTYIVNIDDPNADPIVLDRSFKEHIKQIGQDILGPDGPVGPTSNSYLNKLTGKPDKDYLLYIERRKNYVSSPSFYFNFADWFYAHGDKKRALRVLTSIAELALEDAALYRMLGYRLKEYGEYALEAFVFKKVVQWRPMEPQSYRDYALALADKGDAQAALDSLYGLLTRTYSSNIINRSRGIDEVVVTEINRLIAQNPSLNTSKIDKSLIIDVPVDIRVVINWNMNNTDIDLRVIAPNNEECYNDYYSYYGNKHNETKIGGRLSANNRDGYGPEQFLLKNAINGKYRIFVAYRSDRQFTDAGPTTVMAEIYTKYADKTEQRKIVCQQLVVNGGTAMVAEIDF